MADVITPQVEANALFSFNDIAQGISNVVFFGGATTDSGRVDFILSNSSFYSDPIVFKVLYGNNTGIVNITSPTELFDIDFDLTFGRPRTINGNVIINVPLGMGDAQSGAESRVVTIDGEVLLYHVDIEGSETLLGSETLAVVNKRFTDAEQVAHMFNIVIPVTNQVFREGEKLRLTVKGIFTDDISVSDRGIAGIGCDPQNRDDIGSGEDTTYPIQSTCFPNNVDTNLLIQVPFRID